MGSYTGNGSPVTVPIPNSDLQKIVENWIANDNTGNIATILNSDTSGVKLNTSIINTLLSGMFGSGLSSPGNINVQWFNAQTSSTGHLPVQIGSEGMLIVFTICNAWVLSPPTTNWYGHPTAMIVSPTELGSSGNYVAVGLTYASISANSVYNLALTLNATSSAGWQLFGVALGR